MSRDTDDFVNKVINKVINNPADDLLTISEAARRFNLSVHTIRYWIKTGKLKAKKEGRQYRIAAEDINKLVNKVINKDAEFINKVANKVTDKVVNKAESEEITALRAEVAHLKEENRLLRERIQELQEERLFLRDRILALEGTISSLQETLKTLSQKALPSPGESLGQKLKKLFKRRRKEQEEQTPPGS